jgi:REP element-mobilizing transposase RayT
MRRPRRLQPGARWFVTVRCARAQFRLRPDTQRLHALGLFLGRALAAHTGVHLHAVIQMSNHLHLVLTDTQSELDRFMERFLGPLAKALNAIDGVSGQVFERRYAATEILDDGALVDRLAYAVTNPGAADLVARVEDWPGLCLWPGGQEEASFQRFRKPAHDRAVRAAGGDASAVRREDFLEIVRVELALPELDSGRDVRGEVSRVVRHRLGELAEKRGGKRVLGARKVLAQKVWDAPERPKRSPMPLCHASSLELWVAFRDAWRDFVRSFREASALFRAGFLHVRFPEWSFRPSLPILR